MTGKRVVAVSVKMTPEDAAMLKKAASHLWPGAPVTRSSYVLELAKRGAEAVLRSKGEKKS
jgi:uncharacterized protein (DUF1778 family)